MSLLVERARTWRRQRGQALVQEGGGRLLCAGLAALSVALWCDELLLLPQPLRLAAALAGAAAALAGAWALCWRPWRGNAWPVVLDEAAREFPQLRLHLRPAWELREAREGHTSARLAQAHLADTEALIAGLPDRPAFRWRPSPLLRRAAVLAAAAVLTWPWLSRATWERVLRPWRDVPLERFLTVGPGDAAWSLGQGAELSVRLTDGKGGPRRIAETRLWLRTTGAWIEAPWERQSPERASFTVSSVTEPLQYRVSWKGLRSRVYRLQPESAPQLESLQARLSGQAAAVSVTGAEPLAARRGTWVRLQGRPNQALARAELRASFLPAPLPLQCASGGCEVGFLAREDGSFQFLLESVDGRRDPSPVVFSLRAVPDAPPSAQLLSPVQPVQADSAGSLPVAYAARDDSALTSVSLLIQAPGQPPQERLLQRFGRDAPQELVGDHPWPLTGLPLGARVAFRVKACDDAVPPQCAASEPGSVEIVDFEAGHRETRRRWRQAEDLLGRLAGREERLRDLYASGDLAQARRELPGLPEDWKSAAEAARRLARAMEADAYANPGLRDELSALAGRVEESAGLELSEALAADRGNDASAARRRHERLAGAARRAQKLLEQRRPLQELQDFYMQAGRMGQEGEELASALEKLAGTRKGGAPPEALGQVQETLKRLQERMASLQKAIEALPQAKPGGAEESARRGYSMPLLAAQTSADALQAALRAGDYALASAIAQEMAQQLAAVEAAVTAAAASAAGGAAPRQGAERLEKLQARWAQLVEGQTRLVEASQGLEEKRRGRFVAAQKDLLARLAREESVLLSSAAAYGKSFPADALSLMTALQEELASGRAGRAADLVHGAASAMRASARRSAPGSRHGEAMAAFASAQEEIGRRLVEAPMQPPPGTPDEQTRVAAQGQAEVRGRTAALQRDLEVLAEELGAAPPKAAARLEAAQEEQGLAEADLGKGDTASALGHQEKALEQLEQGGQDMKNAAASQQQIELGIGAGFSQPAGGVRSAPGGGLGARLEPVPRPRARDYLPPRELREELERSLRERRPAAYDPVIKEYFKRISQ
ncbi:MAG: hypothetical protein HY926_10115 [Elusimicrobia bacterium]|nr:hypothetical protein [Elusimicrobiota bacterium]